MSEDIYKNIEKSENESNKIPSGDTYFYENGRFSYTNPALSVIALQKVKMIACGRSHYIFKSSKKKKIFLIC